MWVKPGGARCTTRWQRGEVTGTNSANNVDVDGMARHILDVRRVVSASDSSASEEDANEEEVEAPDRRYPQRERALPGWMKSGDFVTH